MRQKKAWTTEELLTALRDAARTLQRVPTVADLNPAAGRPSYKSFARPELGGLARALRTVGLAPDRERYSVGIAEAEEKAAFSFVVELLGRTPSQHDILNLRKNAAIVLGRQATFDELSKISHVPAPTTARAHYGLRWAELAARWGYAPNQAFHGEFSRKWENVCKRAAIVLYGDSARTKNTKDRFGNRPDIVHAGSATTTYIDAKTSANPHPQVVEQLERYRQAADAVEVWCLSRSKQIEGIRYVYADELVARLELHHTHEARSITKAIVRFMAQRQEVGGRGYYNEEDVLDGIRTLAEHTGRMPTADEIARVEGLPTKSSLRRFGTMVQLAEKAGVQPNSMTHATRAELLAHLTTWKGLNDFDVPTSLHLVGSQHMPNVKLYDSAFGSLDSALIAAGFPERIQNGIAAAAKRLGRMPGADELGLTSATRAAIERLFKVLPDAQAATGWGRALERSGAVSCFRTHLIDLGIQLVLETSESPRYDRWDYPEACNDQVRVEFGSWSAFTTSVLQGLNAKAMTIAASALRTERLRRGLTQRQVAAVISMSQSNYSAFETGRKALSIKDAFTLARLFSVASESFLSLRSR